jgi:hypothetical protein
LKLPAPFIQLPLAFDADALAAEIAALGEDNWLPHPAGYPGNDYLPLVSAGGVTTGESPTGPMAPTDLLLKSPYLMQVLESFGAVWGRSRLMRLAGNAEVTPHADLGYYWRDRLRVHVPIVTFPQVRFRCGPAEINMAAGEAWVFDTWLPHLVSNETGQSRIHLVADTVGGAQFWDLFQAGKPHSMSLPAWSPRRVAPVAGHVAALEYEQLNAPVVMNPWEVRDHIQFLLREAQPGPLVQQVGGVLTPFHRVWRSLWARYGESAEGEGRYRQALNVVTGELRNAGAEQLKLINGASFMTAFSSLVINPALASLAPQILTEDRGSGAVVRPGTLN